MFNLMNAETDTIQNSPAQACLNCGRETVEDTVCPCFYDEP